MGQFCHAVGDSVLGGDSLSRTRLRGGMHAATGFLGNSQEIAYQHIVAEVVRLPGPELSPVGLPVFYLSGVALQCRPAYCFVVVTSISDLIKGK